MRHVWDKETKKWVSREKRPSRSQGIMVIPDTIDDFKSMADGKTYNSKSRYRADLKARGYVEVGNERMQAPKPHIPDATGDIVETMKRRGEW